MSREVKKTLNLYHYFYIGFGAIVGTGWVLMVGDWVTLGGGPLVAIIAFLIGAIFLLPIGAVFGELTSALPVSGGIVEYVERAFGKRVAFFAGWMIAFGDGVLCPWESLAIATILTELFADVFPMLRSIPLYSVMGSQVYLYPVLIALLFSGYVIYRNFCGALQMARLQGILTKMLFIGMGIAMAVSFVKGGSSHFFPLFQEVTGATTRTPNTGFWTAFTSVLVLTPFFYTGLDTIPDQAEEAEEGIDWNQFGKVISFALIASGIFYAICIYSFSTIEPWTVFVNKPIPALACLKDINFILYFVMLVIATLGPLGPMNSLFSATARILLAMGRKKLLPSVFGKLDEKTGTPFAANRLLAVLTIVGPFLGYQMLLPLTQVAALAFIIPCTMVAAACFRMRFTEPDLPRPYRVPGGLWGILLGVLSGLSITMLLIIPTSPTALGGLEWFILLVWLAFGWILYYFRNQ